MNKFISIIAIFSIFSFKALAADVFVKCFTKDFLTTTFLIDTKNEKVNLHVMNHNGGEYAPFWNSIVVPNDLSQLSKKAEIIKTLDKGFKTSWKVEKCTWAGEKLFKCFGIAEKVAAGSIEAVPWTLYSSLLKTTTADGAYESIEMTVRFDANKESLNYTMRYAIDECLISEKDVLK